MTRLVDCHNTYLVYCHDTIGLLLLHVGFTRSSTISIAYKQNLNTNKLPTERQNYQLKTYTKN